MTENASAEEIGGIVADSNWLPYAILDEGRTLKLVHLPRHKLSELTFIDKRSAPGLWERVAGDAPRVQVPVAAIADSARNADSGPCHYIFHSAFCGSTLMSRALDVKGVACVLREPRVLHELGDLKPGRDLPHDQKLSLEVVLDLMQRPRLPGESTIIKPANVANPLIDAIMQHHPNSRALLMYCSLPDFLLAIARGRRWMWGRSLAVHFCDHLEFETKQTQDLLRLTDLQMAAFLWLHHQAQFARLLRQLPAGRFATLRADVFFASPTQSLRAAAEFFSLAWGISEAAEITRGPLFQRHSKRPGERFDEATQKRNDALVKLAFGPEVEQAIKWGEAVAAEASIPLELQAPLIG